ncbi:GPI ethanolamine phosphate transferase 3 isoform X1 [Cucumis melo var. makuwa]|uniref:GPI ethanolamine phosphate transferase 3 isoform X1 n=1 Tax=Cucumis melo var. makuwa TaxID=1194695 RepID=A0A5A7UIH4_CUCMM|nr:GPI ethanolamine phosphate transferase 3 isoform X1 [Cucumis melo var. makuwa]
MKKWSLLWPFWAILAIHGVAILIFVKGFLLTRTELPYFSHCSDVSQSPCFTLDSLSHSNPSVPSPSHKANFSRCWTNPTVNRIIIIVFDALRFDFVAPSSFFEESKPWMDKLRVLHKMASERGSSAKIFKAIADPPTTSLQRLKGITTGGLPTFIDIGNSFGAPAIIEDNLIHQLVQNGKRVVMMGDDTWMQLFPNHFQKAFPYPSFNVKDLHTVDNGCIEHLLPSLYENDWDVLIAHFLGVDHAGHIFGVDSSPMFEKLEQYNTVLEKVVDVLESQSKTGGLHENTLLLVMGDHGQTLNGDHGGGSAEEVETSLFAMSFNKLSGSLPSEFGTSSCQLDSQGREICTSSIQQLDFPVTLSALLGIPFPYGSIGRVNPELYALGAGSMKFDGMKVGSYLNQSGGWMQNYVNALCINSWQVKRYIDNYTASSVIGFSDEDLLHTRSLYDDAMENWSHISKGLLSNDDGSDNISSIKRQIERYSNFLASVAELARSKWTEFNLKMMTLGFGLMLASLLIHFLAIKRVSKLTANEDCGTTFELMLSCFLVAIRACSFLSNSFILEEGKVTSFLLATTAIIMLRYSIAKQKHFLKFLLQVVIFLLLMIYCRFTIEVGLLKQADTSAFLKVYPSWVLEIASLLPGWTYVTEAVPIIALILLVQLLLKNVAGRQSKGIWQFVVYGTIFCYILTGVHWALENDVLHFVPAVDSIGKNCIPRIIYAIGLGQLSLLLFRKLFGEDKSLNCRKTLVTKTVAMLAAWSPTVIILAGKQGSLVALASVLGGYCIISMDNLKHGGDGNDRILTVDSLPVTQWSLFAICLFFSSGHWCAFDGLRYAAAFIGFDEFVLVRQAVLLMIDTFGFSIILPIFGLPFIVANKYSSTHAAKVESALFMGLSQAYLMYGLVMAVPVTATILCVILQRRHLMVWGLFAPKFVFDVVALILTDGMFVLGIGVSLLHLMGIFGSSVKKTSI